MSTNQVEIQLPSDEVLGIAPGASEVSREAAVFHWLRGEGFLHHSLKTYRQAAPFWDFKPGDPHVAVIEQAEPSGVRS